MPNTKPPTRQTPTPRKTTAPRYVVGLTLEEWRGKSTIYDTNRPGYIYKSRRRGEPIARAYSPSLALRICRALNASRSKGKP